MRSTVRYSRSQIGAASKGRSGAKPTGRTTLGDLGKGQGSRLWGVLVTWRRPQELLVMLDSLDSQSIRLKELAVIDNDPSPETRAIATDGSRGTRVNYAAAKENLGPAGGIAVGMEQVISRADDGDWIVLLDDDDPPPRVRSLEELKEMGDELLARTPGSPASGSQRLGSTGDRGDSSSCPRPSVHPVHPYGATTSGEPAPDLSCGCDT